MQMQTTAAEDATATEVAPAGGLGPEGKGARSRLALSNLRLRQVVLIGSFFAMIIFFWAERPSTYPKKVNIENLINGMPVLTALAIAVTVVLILGEFDLSAPNVAELT